MTTKIRFLGVAGYEITNSRGQCILIDPFLDHNPGSPLKSHELERVDLICVSHAAFDHLGDTEAIARRTNAPVVCGGEVKAFLMAKGLPADQLRATVWGIRVEVAGIAVQPVECHHWSQIRMPDGTFASGVPMGFVVDVDPGVRFYHYGDVDGERVNIRSPPDAIKAGIGYLPEDRKEAGLFLDMSIADNIAAARLDHFNSWWMSNRRRDAVAGEYLQKLRIAAPDVRRAVENLSGGNQQKVVLARWLLLNPRVLIVDEPTRGIDIGAKREVHFLLYELAKLGTAVIVISSDLPEVMEVADRVLVMREGRIGGELRRGEATPEKIMRYASVAPEEREWL